jgi:hypothetical protein
MENEVVSTAPAPAPVETYTPAPVSSSSGGGDDVFENMGSQKPMDFKSLLVFGLLIAFSIYGITYYRKAIAKLNDDKKPTDDFLNLVDDVEEVKFNVKKALGKNYKTT